jgi:hypothetical protein
MEDENWAKEVEGGAVSGKNAGSNVTRPHQPSAYVSNWADEVDSSSVFHRACMCHLLRANSTITAF